MTRRRFFVPPDDLAAPGAGRTVTLAPEESRHLRDVLRLKPGDEAFIFDGVGGEYLCTIAAIGRGGRGGGGNSGAAILTVRERIEPRAPESPLRLTLAVALLKSEKFDLVVQKATELGVTRILPVITKRIDVRPRETSERTTRWRRLAVEAAKQSGRAVVPMIDAPLDFASLITSRIDEEGQIRLLFSERSGEQFADWARQVPTLRPAAATAVIGPEGGWADEEIAPAAAAGWTIITLGGRTLRAETAAITVVALLQHLCGDL